MIIRDRVYGNLEITNPLIVELIQSQPFQRLKHISQDGAAHYIQPIRDVTRYEHCIGTWYLSDRYKRPLEEQVASLLHDIPHTAFSHVVDLVMEDENHEYHDRFIETIILNSEIPEILKRHKVKLEDILSKDNFPLLNNKLPNISFDRLDYFLRDGYTFRILSKEQVALFLDKLKEKEQQFYFTDTSTASLFAILFMNSSRLIWLDPTSHGSFFLLGHALKIALNKHYITEKDFFQTDDTLMKQLQQTNDKEILAYLKRLQEGRDFHYASKEHAEFFGPNKPRYVDPLVMIENKLKRLTTIVPGFEEYFEEFARRYKYLGVTQKMSQSG